MEGAVWGVNEFSFSTLHKQGLEDPWEEIWSLEGTVGPDDAETLL